MIEKGDKTMRHDCIACGQSESVCPHHLPIIELLKGVAARLDA